MANTVPAKRKLHLRKLTWNLKMMVFNRNLLFQGSFSGSMLVSGGVPVVSSMFFSFVFLSNLKCVDSMDAKKNRIPQKDGGKLQRFQNLGKDNPI